jgi:putative peptidoglycan lipid II flippase
MMPDRQGDFNVTAAATPAAARERQLIGALGSISLATLASRVLGFGRDVVVALAFGAGPVTDAFFVAFRIPNVLRRLLAEGALSTAIVPVFGEYAATRSRDELRRMLRAVLGAGLLVLFATTALGIALAPWLLALIAPGFGVDPGQRTLAVGLTRVMFPYLALVGLAALATGALHTCGRFLAAALGPAVLNLAMIAAVLLLAARLEPPVLALALGVLAGGVGQVLVQLPSLARAGLLVGPSAELGHPALRRVGRLLVPAVVGLAAVQLMVFVNTLLASLLAPGSISYLYYADRVMEFPLGVFGIALATASLPAMARQAAEGDTRGVLATVSFALRVAVWICLPATVALVLLAGPIVTILFERGAFGAAAGEATAAALRAYALGLVGFAGARIAAQAFYALGRPGTAVRLGALAVVVNAAAAVALMGPLAHVGLALASSLGAWVNLAGLLVAARRLGPLGGRGLAASIGRTALASAPVALWCVAARGAGLLAPDAGLAAAAAALGVVVGGGVVVFWLASALVGCQERHAVRETLLRRRSD